MKKLCSLFIVVLVLVLFAGCAIDPDATYSVTYIGNGNTYGFYPVDNTEYKSGDEVIVLGKNTLDKTGYEFLKWNTKPDGTGDSYSEGDRITIKNSNIRLYAIWVVKP